ncbi:MAG: hypothetical protein ACLUOI_20315 [Eisenbergiella sp.]
MNYLLRLEDWDEAVLIFIDGTICDMRHRYQLWGRKISRRKTGQRQPTRQWCLNELAEVYELVYRSQTDIYTDATHKWLLDAGFGGKVYLGSSQQERLDIVKELKKRFVFGAESGISGMTMNCILVDALSLFKGMES